MSGNERNESVRLGSPATSSANSTPHYPQNPQIGISGLDPVDLEFLMKKGAFVLPHRDSLYEAGSYSPFLMQTVLTSATLYVSTDVLTSCGYSNITEAQTAFFNKALLLHDFQYVQLRGLYKRIWWVIYEYLTPVALTVKAWLANSTLGGVSSEKQLGQIIS
ncbi:cutinase transcription factor 1 beta [Colletotrichum asianum]